MHRVNGWERRAIEILLIMKKRPRLMFTKCFRKELDDFIDDGIRMCLSGCRSFNIGKDMRWLMTIYRLVLTEGGESCWQSRTVGINREVYDKFESAVSYGADVFGFMGFNVDSGRYGKENAFAEVVKRDIINSTVDCCDVKNVRCY
jgi:hypothetical protein